MKNLPDVLSETIPKHQSVVWHGRTSTLDALPKLASVLYRTLLIFFLARWGLIIGLSLGWKYILGFTIIWIVVVHAPWTELYRWSRRYYVVTQLSEPEGNAKGNVYEITGAHFFDFKRGHKKLSDPISTSWPSQDVTERAWQVWWKRLTGQAMVDIVLDDPGRNIAIKGQRLSPEFSKAISKVQGNAKSAFKPDMSGQTVSLLEETRLLARDELITPNQAQKWAVQLIEQEIGNVDHA